MEDFEKCPVCSFNRHPFSGRFDSSADIIHIKCPVCGTFKVRWEYSQDYSEANNKLSAALRYWYERGYTKLVCTENFQDIINSVPFPKTPLEQIDLILDYINKNTRNYATGVHIYVDHEYTIAFAKDGAEFKYFLSQAMKMNYIRLPDPSKGLYCFDIEGWKRLDEISYNTKVSNQAFVAMWFDESIKDAYDNGIHIALVETGYRPLKINDKEHNEKICDVIVSEIKKSSLVIADLTGHRGGVYYEAGFAQGLGIPVIWCCREKDFEARHFDIRQYNCIKWNTAADLKESLIKRIEATLK